MLVFRKRQLETAARKRRAALSASSGSGPAKVENAGRGASRDDIVAARRQRREQQKSSTRNPQTTPARYRRKRTEATAPVETIEPEEADDSFDPLEHEEVKLNLEGFDLPAPEHEPDGAHQE